MSQPGPSLAQLQLWMQAMITHPHAGAPVPGSPASSAESGWPVAEVIAPSSRQTSEQRLQVYAQAYTARLLEVLESDYPALHHAVGADAFTRLALGYLQQSPSTSYTLTDLGTSFPAFLAASRPARASTEPDWADFLVDLARLERIYTDVFDGPGIESLPPLDVSQLLAFSPEEWLQCRLTAAPCLRLATFRFPVHAYVTAVRQGTAPEMPAAVETGLVITRREFVVRRTPVEPTEYAVLDALVSSQSVGEALALLDAHDASQSGDDLVIQVQRWFQRWFTAAYFTEIVPSR